MLVKILLCRRRIPKCTNIYLYLPKKIEVDCFLSVKILCKHRCILHVGKLQTSIRKGRACQLFKEITVRTQRRCAGAHGSGRSGANLPCLAAKESATTLSRLAADWAPARRPHLGRRPRRSAAGGYGFRPEWRVTTTRLRNVDVEYPKNAIIYWLTYLKFI